MTTDPPPSLKTLPLRDGSVVAGLSPQTPQTPATPTSMKGLTPLSSKVTSVLSTSYGDAEFRDALALFDERGLQNTAETRRRLRLDLEKEVIDSNGAVISEFGRVADQLRKIKATLDALNREYQEAKSEIQSAHDETEPVLAEASSILAQKASVEMKQQLLSSFQTQFILTDDEVAWLTSSAEPVDDRFFAALSKAKKISRDSEILLGFESQTLGLQLMEQTSKHVNLAFQKLYRWIQREFKALNLENPQINSSIRRALRVLAERPSLFQNCLDFFAGAREHILSDSFYVALTGTTPSGIEDRSVKPIEMAAHDSLRYVGDMLAWSHSAAVSEREALEVLFISDGDEIAKGLRSGRQNEPWRLVSEEDDPEPEFDAVKALNDLVDRDMAGASRMLRQRVEQVIQSNEETILAYRLANLLGFYRFTFSRLLGQQSVLLESLASLETEALRQFRSLMRDHIATLQGEFQQTPSNLSPPEFLADALKQLDAIMKTYDTSLAASSDREAEFQPILREAFQPFMAGCENVAQAIESPADAMFLINCRLAAISALQSYEFTAGMVRELQGQVASEARRLVASQYAFLREGSGLEELIEALGPLHNSDIDLSKLQSLTSLRPERLIQASQILDDFLPSALMDAMENVAHLQDAKIAREVTEEAAAQFCENFESIENVLLRADELAGKGAEAQGISEELRTYRSMFPRTTGEIRVLLS